MANNIVSYIFLGVVVVFIFMINSINLKKNRAIHARAVMLNLKDKHEKNPDGITDEELGKAVQAYNDAASEFNAAISSGVGTILNVMLRYPEFEIVSVED